MDAYLRQGNLKLRSQTPPRSTNLGLNSRRTLAARGDLIPSVLHKGGRKGAERGDIYICSLLLEGSFFGDMEVLLGVRRLADIKALSNVELLVICMVTRPLLRNIV